MISSSQAYPWRPTPKSPLRYHRRFPGNFVWACFGLETIVNDLLSLPGGIHFRELILLWIRDDDLPSMMDLISACSHTLESIHVNHTKRTHSRSLLWVHGGSLCW